MPGGGALTIGLDGVAELVAFAGSPVASGVSANVTLAFAATVGVDSVVEGCDCAGGERYSSEARAPLPVAETGMEVERGGGASSLALLARSLWLKAFRFKLLQSSTNRLFGARVTKSRS